MDKAAGCILGVYEEEASWLSTSSGYPQDDGMGLGAAQLEALASIIVSAYKPALAALACNSSTLGSGGGGARKNWRLSSAT